MLYKSLYFLNFSLFFIKKEDVALRINPTIYCINFYFLKQYIVYKSFSATAPLKFNFDKL